MLLKNLEERYNPSSEMLYGKYGVWHLAPERNLNEKRDQITTPFEKSEHSFPTYKRANICGPTHHKKWLRLREHVGHDRKQIKFGMGQHETNSYKFHDIISKIYQVREEQSKRNFSSMTSFPHRLG